MMHEGENQTASPLRRHKRRKGTLLWKQLFDHCIVMHTSWTTAIDASETNIGRPERHNSLVFHSTSRPFLTHSQLFISAGRQLWE